jgi:hypothetical protein
VDNGSGSGAALPRPQHRSLAIQHYKSNIRRAPTSQEEVQISINAASSGEVRGTGAEDGHLGLGNTSAHATPNRTIPPFTRSEEHGSGMSQRSHASQDSGFTDEHIQEQHDSDRAGQTEDILACQSLQTRSTSVKKRKNGNWKDDDLRGAIAAVDDGMNIRRVVAKFGIPRLSLEDWLYGRTRSHRRGKEGTLTAEEEHLIVQWICKCQDMGWPLTNLDLRLKVCEIKQTRSTPFKNGIPGVGWLRWWKRRHPELSLRVP